jgi:hypothetical protein
MLSNVSPVEVEPEYTPCGEPCVTGGGVVPPPPLLPLPPQPTRFITAKMSKKSILRVM